MAKTETIRFGVIADIHLDIMHDGKRRMETFLEEMRRQDVDFIIQLGDFTYPDDTSRSDCAVDKMPPNIKLAYKQKTPVDTASVLKMYNDFEKPKYHVFGNHDFDFISRQGAVEMFGAENTYYSFHKNGWHFIVLDGNYMKDEKGEYKHYEYGQYFYQDLPWLPPEEMEWLRNEMETSSEPIIMFSHQPLFGMFGGVKNYKEFQALVAEYKAKGKRIRMCINGHLHIDKLDEIDGVLYYNMNSMSNLWVDLKYEYKGRYSDKLEEKFPNLRYTLPYQKPLWAVVTLDEEGVKVDGRKGKFVYPGPKQIGFDEWFVPTCHIESWQRKW